MWNSCLCYIHSVSFVESYIPRRATCEMSTLSSVAEGGRSDRLCLVLPHVEG